MNRLSRLLFLVFLVVGVAACSTTASTAPADATTTFILVRHAEKGTDDARDPSLNDAGRARAVRLTRLLSDEPLTAVYATAYRRTQQTAQPVADGHGIVVTTYDAKTSDSAFASQLRAAHARGTVLVVGHSNTVPGIVAALSGTAVDAIQDDQFDRTYRISIGPDGKAMLSQNSY
jgi:broad specificity phosphatase PhoE